MPTNQQKGFTLIELMITLVMLVIVVSIAVPNYLDWIKNNRMDTSTRSIASVLQLARSEAVTRQSIISVGDGTTTDAGWTNGVHIYTDTGAGGSDYSNVNDTLIKDVGLNLNGINVTTNDNNNSISFSSTGLLNEPTATVLNPRTITICHADGTTQGNQIIINTVGRASITTTNGC